MPVLGARAHDYRGSTPDELFANIAGDGFAAAQLAFKKSFGIAYPVPEAFLEETAVALQKHKLQLAVVGCYIDPALPDRDAAKTQVDTFISGPTFGCRWEKGVAIKKDGVEHHHCSIGNGRLDAVSTAIKSTLDLSYHLVAYNEHALERSSKASAIAYVGIELENGKIVWGAGKHTDIIVASINALVSAVNRTISME